MKNFKSEMVNRITNVTSAVVPDFGVTNLDLFE